MPENLAIVIGGPTASGKSRLAIDLALTFDGVVVNADASQVYKSIPVISAAPSAEDKQKAPHRLYEYLEDEENGNVVCIEAKSTMTFDIHYHVRLISADEYQITTYEGLRGFVSGLYAGNYDISQVFIDNLCKTVGADVDAETEKFLNWLDVFGERNNIKFTVTISGDVETATDGMRKYL